MEKEHVHFFWLINGDDGFGVSRATVSFAKEIEKDHKKIKFISLMKGRLYDLLCEAGFEVYCLDIPLLIHVNSSSVYFFKNTLRMLAYNKQIKEKVQSIIDRYQFDFLIFRSSNFVQIASMLKCKQAKKVWIMPNAISTNYFLALNKRLFQWTCYTGGIQVIANSRYTATTISGKLIKPNVLHLGVDESRFDVHLNESGRKKRTDYGLALEDMVFGIFARANKMKAQDLVIKAFALLIKKYPDLPIKLLLIGVEFQAAFSKECLSLVEELQINKQVVFEGVVSDMENYYGIADVIINSRRDAEPFGLTVIESMLMEKPVLALGLGGPAETIIDGHTGWLIKEPTVDAYFKGLELALTDHKHWSAMGAHGRTRALENFTVGIAYKNLMKIIN